MLKDLFQYTKGGTMKKSAFANIVKHKDGYIIHNSLFGGIVRAKCKESMAFLDLIEAGEDFEFDDEEKFHQTLKDMRMIIDKDVDESCLASFYFNEIQGKELLIIPFVTRQCNFRCSYCFDDFNNNRMSEDTYNDLLKIIEDLVDAKGYKSVRVSFFGGEPLLEYEEICKFSQKMNDLAERKEIKFFGGMTTNAYLLTADRLEKLVKLNVTQYQITVDGLKETHDISRPLMGGKGSWDAIMKNLIDAKESELNFDFNIRTNFDYNVQQISEQYLVLCRSIF